jgi:hypothetical protein
MAQSAPPRISATRPLSNAATPPIPQPAQNGANVWNCLVALKTCVESLIGQRGDPNNRAVTFNDLIQYGLISPGTVAGGGTGPAPAATKQSR